MSEIVCKNCSHHVEGNFCSNCGQTAHTHKIDAKYFLHDIPHSILHVDRGFPFTFWQLVTRPSKALAEYIDGKRARFFRPFAYVVLMSAIGSLLVNQIRLQIQHLHLQRGGNTIIPRESFFSHYPSIFIFLMIPFVSLTTWLIFKGFRYNFWENVLVNTYLAAQLNVLLVLIQVFSLIKLVLTDSYYYSLTLFLTCFMGYYAWTFSGLLYKEMKGWKLGLRLGIMCFFLATIYAIGMSFTGILKLGLK